MARSDKGAPSVTKRPRAPKPMPPEAPPTIPQTEQERQASADMCRRLQELTRVFQQRNLDAAVRLAMEAAAGRGDLVEHFAELGRRFGDTLNQAPARAPSRRPELRVITGGAA